VVWGERVGAWVAEEDGRGGCGHIYRWSLERAKYVPVTKFYSKPYISVVLCAVCYVLCVCNCVLSCGIYRKLTVERHSAEDSMTGLLHTDR
jgi:hypothetical protein